MNNKFKIIVERKNIALIGLDKTNFFEPPVHGGYKFSRIVSAIPDSECKVLIITYEYTQVSN